MKDRRRFKRIPPLERLIQDFKARKEYHVLRLMNKCIKMDKMGF